MPVERKGEQITITTETGTVAIAPMKMIKSGFDESVLQAWQDECAKLLKPNARLACELAEYLTARYDLEILTAEDIQMQLFLENFILNHFEDRLKHRPPHPSSDMTDKELENWQRETEAQREEIRTIPPERFGLKVRGFRILHTEKNEPLIDADRRQWWERWGNDHCKDTENFLEPDGYLCYEETTGVGSGSGFGGGALLHEAILFLGITAEDIEGQTPRFLGYACALSEEGKLPSLSDLMNREQSRK